MKIFEDFETKTEVLSDSYPITEVFDGVGYEVQSAEIVKGDEKIDVGCGNAFGDQAAEEPAEEVYKVNNIIDSFGYQETTFTKALYGKYVKDYMKRVLDHLTAKRPDRVEAFKKGAQEMAKWIIANYDDFTLYNRDNLVMPTGNTRATT